MLFLECIALAAARLAARAYAAAAPYALAGSGVTLLQQLWWCSHMTELSAAPFGRIKIGKNFPIHAKKWNLELIILCLGE